MDLLDFLSRYEVIISLICGGLTILGGVIGAIWEYFRVKWRVESLKRENAKLERENHELIDKVNVNPDKDKLIRQVRETLKDTQERLEKSEAEKKILDNQLIVSREEWDSERNRSLQVVEDLTEELEKAKNCHLKVEKTLRSQGNLVKKALKLEGQFWEKKPLTGIPKFKPLKDRKSAIISILNLKGGVGKTTTTAHLGAALARQGYRVLLVDLDLQGSLSSLFVFESELLNRSQSGKLLQHFLTNSARVPKIDLRDFVTPILDGKSALLATTDKLAYAELNLTMEWLLRVGKKDTRFLLRRGLHQRRITSMFDIVLMDCPPLINTCCVNALAASDYVLIPVTPSQKAVERVPLLLHRIKRLTTVVNPDLQILGMLLNRTRSGQQLTSWENDLWAELAVNAKDQWELPVHCFKTMIRQTAEVRDSETQFHLPDPKSELYGVFNNLVSELEARLPGECRRTAQTSI